MRSQIWQNISVIAFAITGVLLLTSIYLYRRFNIANIIKERKTTVERAKDFTEPLETEPLETELLDTEPLDNQCTTPLTMNLIKNIVVTHVKEESNTFE